MRLLCISILMMLASLHDGADAISCCSVCECRSHEVWCEYRHLKTVPDEIPTNTPRLYLFNTDISTIPNGAFTNLKVSLLPTSSMFNYVCCLYLLCLIMMQPRADCRKVVTNEVQERLELLRVFSYPLFLMDEQKLRDYINTSAWKIKFGGKHQILRTLA